MHLAFRLSGDPLRVFHDAGDRVGAVVGTMVVGGARAGYYVRDVSRPLHSVGAVLRPGAATVLFGVTADELAERHTALEDLWGAATASLRDELSAQASACQRLDAFERALTARLPSVRGVHPAVARALQQLHHSQRVRDVVGGSGYSHRRFITLFSRAVGLTPKAYSRVLRFQRVLRAAAIGEGSFADLAVETGYSDQSHFNREFLEFAGVTPTEYRRTAPALSHHVPVATL
jgi:AraC-like DNA-binding protein